jgi:hypothetical protein
MITAAVAQVGAVPFDVKARLDTPTKAATEC